MILVKRSYLFISIIVVLILFIHAFICYFYLIQQVPEHAFRVPLLSYQQSTPIWIIEQEQSIPEEPQEEREEQQPISSTALLEEHKEPALPVPAPSPVSLTQWNITSDEEATTILGHAVEKNDPTGAVAGTAVSQNQEPSPSPAPVAAPVSSEMQNTTLANTTSTSEEHNTSSLDDSCEQEHTSTFKHDSESTIQIFHESPFKRARQKRSAVAQQRLVQLASNFEQEHRNKSEVTDRPSSAHIIAQRVRQFKRVSYQQKVFQAISDASLRSARINVEHTIFRMITAVLTIGKKGNLIKVTLNPGTTDQRMDQHIINIIKKSQFPSFPQHFQDEVIDIVSDIYVQFPHGTGAVHFQYR